ncbi:hypothetical protein MX652_08185 [Thauera aromatica]|nr:hypothetical protein [Thauera aromatica]MCK2126665.1 hypothetical protein [Thauera aromatica]
MNKIRDFLNEYGASAAIIGLLVFVFNKHEKSIDRLEEQVAKLSNAHFHLDGRVSGASAHPGNGAAANIPGIQSVGEIPGGGEGRRGDKPKPDLAIPLIDNSATIRRDDRINNPKTIDKSKL